MEDTLRYFFSAMFQGFAAIITLGAMYFLYYFERSEARKNRIIDQLKWYEETKPDDEIYANINVIEQAEKILSKTSRPKHKALVIQYRNLEIRDSKIKEYLPILLKKTIAILICSMISLFLIGYYNWLNTLLMIIGIGVIIISINVLLSIKNIINEIISN